MNQHLFEVVNQPIAVDEIIKKFLEETRELLRHLLER